MALSTRELQADDCLSLLGLRRCRRCNEIKKRDHFGRQKNSPSGRSHHCHPCIVKRSDVNERKRKARDPEKYLEQKRQARSRYIARAKRADPAAYRSSWRAGQLRQRYQLSEHDFDVMFALQDGRCAICMTPTSNKWCTDHDHASGVVRGVLCNNCNLAIGLFRDDPDVLHQAQIYLRPRVAEVSPGAGSSLSSPAPGESPERNP
jgi:hypothetical protein